MKPSPRPASDPSIHVRHQVWEAPEESARFHEGIYEVTLAHRTGVMFVPDVRREEPPWPPSLPVDADHPATEVEARRFTVALSSLSVTPSATRAGLHEVIRGGVTEGDGVGEHTIFYVAPDEFQHFTRELAEVAARLHGVHDSIPLLDLRAFGFIRWMEINILPLIARRL